VPAPDVAAAADDQYAVRALDELPEVARALGSVHEILPGTEARLSLGAWIQLSYADVAVAARHVHLVPSWKGSSHEAPVSRVVGGAFRCGVVILLQCFQRERVRDERICWCGSGGRQPGS